MREVGWEEGVPRGVGSDDKVQDLAGVLGVGRRGVLGAEVDASPLGVGGSDEEGSRMGLRAALGSLLSAC
jgi:hypothetical protein